MNVLIISVTFIPSVLLCGHCQLEYLQKQGKLNYRFVIAHFINKRDIEWADTIIFLRSDSDIEAYVSKIAKKKGIHTVYVLDDDLLNAPNYLSSSYYYNLPSTKNNMRTIMKNCDTFLTPSPVLLNKYKEWFKYSFNIAEPSLNRINKKEANEKVKIGFAGSIDRAQDLNLILEDAITKLVDKYGDSISIEFMGAKPAFVEKLGLKYLPYQDGYDAYTAFMARCNWDIGLAPMPVSDFHKCKYFNKYVEYASFGIAGVYSNVEPYIFGIKDEYNGLLVENNTESWVNGISRLIDDNLLRKKISDVCLKEANEIYALDILSEDFFEKLLVGYTKKQEVTIGSFVPAKTIIFFKRVYRKVVEQGTDFPSWLRKKLDEKKQKFDKANQDKKNLEQVKNIIKNRKSVCIFAPFFDDSKESYTSRVRQIDDLLGKDIYKIYISGEDRITENLMVDLIDENHAYVVCNSYDVNQGDEILNLISSTKNVLVHSVIRFMGDKISSDLLKMFEIKDVNVILDTHGNVPEQYHEASNYHTESVVSEIEKTFINKASYALCFNNKNVEILKNKYKESNIIYMEIPEESNNDISSIIK